MPSPATIVIGLLLLAVVVLIVRHQWKQHKKGGCACGGGCDHCNGGCH